VTPVHPSPACARQVIVAGDVTLNYATAHDSGSYTEQIPTTAAPEKPLPVIFDFHGYAEPGQLQVMLSGLGSYGRTHHFVTITPWINNRSVPYWLSTVGSKDLAWFGELLSHVESTTCVDENRVFVTGYSNGAFMSSAIAYEYSSRVAAVAPIAGIQAVSPCRTTRPVPVVAFHGTADPLVHYDGSASTTARDLPAPAGSRTLSSTQLAKIFGVAGVFSSGPSVPQQAASWAKRTRCTAKESATPIASDVTLLVWPCPTGANVELFRVGGGGHTWPGSEVSAALASVVGRTTMSISADAEMWSFFRVHPLTR